MYNVWESEGLFVLSMIVTFIVLMAFFPTVQFVVNSFDGFYWIQFLVTTCYLLAVSFVFIIGVFKIFGYWKG